jgi:cell division protein FtsB
MKWVARKSGVWVLIAVIAIFTVIAFRGPNGVPVLREKRREVQLLQEQNATLAAENERRKQRIERLKNSRAEQELEIRERLKLLKPGETQFVLPDPPQPQTEPRP